jgi:imidazolonepropionase
MTIAIVNCGELLTLRGPARPRVGTELRDLGIVRQGAILIRSGRIAYAGRARGMNAPRGAKVIDARGRVVMPGFVDAHTHLVFGGNRVAEFEQRIAGATYESIAAAGGGILSTVRATRAASEASLLDSAERRLRWMIRNGTTALEIKSGYGLSLEAELKMLRVIRALRERSGLRVAATFLGAHTVPRPYQGRAAAYLDRVINEMLPIVAREKLAEFADVFCEKGAFNPAQSRRYLAAAQAHGFKLRTHVDQMTRNGGAQLAARMGAVTADHLEQTGADGIAALRRANVQPVLLPGSVYALGKSKYADARAMITAGLAVVLATDFNPGSSPIPSMPLVLSLAATQMRMTPAESITATTINAAHSLGWGSELGSLETGKRADVVIHDCLDHRELAYYAGVEPAAAVVAGGKIIYEILDA